MPNALARHNQLRISTDLKNSSKYSTPPNKPEQELEMADKQEIVTQAVAVVRQMPSYQHHTAPKISENQLHELKRFFEKLANLFGPANITMGADKKVQTIHYVEVNTADIWKSIPEYFNPNSSYEDWKKKVVSLYPGANEEKRWTITDVDKLIGEHARMGIYMLGDLGAYYCTFYTISMFLVQKNRMSQAE